MRNFSRLTRAARALTGLVALAISGLAIAAPALAQVTVTPSRVVLSADRRAAKITVFNGGSHSLHIQAGWGAIRQSEDGVLYPVPQGAPVMVAKALHLWPRDIILRPGDSAPVYVLLDPKTPEGLSMHTQLRIDAERQNGSGPRWGLSLPVFVRAPGLGVSVQITGIAQNDRNTLMVSLYRHGGATPYGTLMVHDPDGKIIGVLNNVTLYANGRPVRFSIPLRTSPHNTVMVSYLGRGEFETQTFDQRRFSLGRVR